MANIDPDVTFASTSYASASTASIVNGRIIAATDENALFYDLDDVRHEIKSDGHSIENNQGQIVAQTKTLQFAGDLSLDNDIQNDKTVVTPHLLTDDEMSDIVYPLPSGGGSIQPPSSGGHKIVNEYNNIMPQRSKLKFSGCSLSDDIGNDTTVVSVTSGNTYSTSESIVGKWVDGRDVFQIVVDEKLMPDIDPYLINDSITYLEDNSHQGANVIANILNNTSGNGYNWNVNPTGQGLIVLDVPYLVKRIKLYTTDNWGYSFTDYNLYWGEDDSLTLSNFTEFSNIQSASVDYTFSQSVFMKRIVLDITKSGGATYYIQIYSDGLSYLDFNFSVVDKVLEVKSVSSLETLSTSVKYEHFTDSGVDYVKVSPRLNQYHVLKYVKKVVNGD